MEWRTQPQQIGGSQRLQGLAFTHAGGYLIAGSISNWYTANKLRVQVMRTDEVGKVGSCLDQAVNWVDTAYFKTDTLVWRRAGNGQAISGNISLEEHALNMQTETVCSATDCKPAPEPTNACLSTFVGQYAGKYGMIPKDFTKVSDGYIVVGYRLFFWSAEPLVFKVGLDGSIRWSKTLTAYMHQGTFKQILHTPDGNLIIVGGDDLTIGHGGWHGTSLTKITPQGAVLWSRKVYGDIQELRSTGNGEFTGSLITSYGSPPINVFLFRMDAAGTFLWTEQLNSGYDNYPLHAKVVTDGKDYYAAGNFYNAQQHTIQLERVDASGKVVWSNHFNVNDNSIQIQSLYLLNDSLYVFANVLSEINPFTHKKNLAVISFGKNGKEGNRFMFAKPDVVTIDRSYYFLNHHFLTSAATQDGHLIMAEQTSSGTDTMIAITKFTTAGDVVWAKQYPNLKNHKVSAVHDDNGSVVVLARKYDHTIDNTAIYSVLLMHTDVHGVVEANATGICQSENIQINKVPVSINTFLSRTSQSLAAEHQWEETSLIARPVRVDEVIGCSTTGDCSTVKIQGTSTICNYSDTLKYRLVRNRGCTLPVLWIYDQSAIRLKSATDTTAIVEFLKTGATKLLASINTGCGTITDSFSIEIVQPASTLNIGKDTVICPDGTIHLSGTTQYKSYRWQDGSADSVFAVSKPGVYHLEVQDACSRFNADTIIVSAKTPAATGLGPDRTICAGYSVRLQASAGFAKYTWGNNYRISTTNGPQVTVAPLVDTFYFLKAEEAARCVAYDTIGVKVLQSPPLDLGADVQGCIGDSVVLNVGAAFRSALWSTGDTGNRITVSKSGTYHVTAIAHNGCISRDTLKILEFWSLPEINLDRTVTLCAGTTSVKLGV